MNKRPKILLVGVGKFGKNHLRVLKGFHENNLIEFMGVVSRSEEKRRTLENEEHIKTFSEITPDLLKSVDAVDIVTPPETHFEMVKKCLHYTNVFVEKPLAMNKKDADFLEKLARTKKRTLVVGHIFRHHTLTEKFKKLVGAKETPTKISGSFINPIDSDQGREPSLELLHLFDIVDFLGIQKPQSICSRNEGRVSIIDIRYNKKCDTRFILGWKGNHKVREITFIYSKAKITVDFVQNSITVEKNKKKKIYEHKLTEEPLTEELLHFVKTLTTHRKSNAKMAARIISIAELTIPQQKKRPTVAVIGGGIFGTSVAAELGKFCDVTLFERNPTFLQEGSLVNQFRHHYGYHYPRSDETVYDIQYSRADFEEIFNDALFLDYPTYYGLAKRGSRVNSADFITFCKKHKLPYKKEFPDDDLLSKKEIDLSIRVPEPSYNHAKLKEITEARMISQNINVLYNTTVTGCVLTKDGIKKVSYSNNNKKAEKNFDFVVNGTYANINRFATWLNFEQCPIRVDLAEVLIVKIPIEPVSITVVDGLFATLMPTGNPHEFTLYHVKESIIDRYVPQNGLVKKPKGKKSNAKAIFKESLKFFPILKDAEIIESRIVHRGVRAYHEHDDSRVADLIEHGFGCWSILSGKILSSVTTAKRLSEIIRRSIAS